MKKYKNEIEKYPHPQLLESIKNRSAYWGSSIGETFAESFFIVRKIA